MARFSGVIGFARTVKTAPGVYSEDLFDRRYRGDIIRNSRRYQTGENLNSTLTIENQISILADDYAYENIYNIRYVEWLKTRWSITSIDVQRPRIIITIGGVYNGPESRSTDTA